MENPVDIEDLMVIAAEHADSKLEGLTEVTFTHGVVRSSMIESWLDGYVAAQPPGSASVGQVSNGSADED